jgi:hypothetical protein
MMPTSVRFAISEEEEIVDGIVEGIFVDVVDSFLRAEFPTDNSHNNPSRFLPATDGFVRLSMFPQRGVFATHTFDEALRMKMAHLRILFPPS